MTISSKIAQKRKRSGLAGFGFASGRFRPAVIAALAGADECPKRRRVATLRTYAFGVLFMLSLRIQKTGVCRPARRAVGGGDRRDPFSRGCGRREAQ